MRIYFVEKRYLIIAILPAIALFIIISPYYSERHILEGKIIIIDAGHGGIDPGANRPGIQEKDINLSITLEVRKVLENKGAKVVLTRDTDNDLSELCDNEKVRGRYRRDLHARREMIQEENADFFVSIHGNSSPHLDRQGIECYYAKNSEEGKSLAYAIQEQLVTFAPISQEAKAAEFYVLNNSKIPAVLIEVGFITNKEERILLQLPDYQKKIAEAITMGIESYSYKVSQVQ